MLHMYILQYERFLSTVDNLYAGIVFDPRSKALVTSNMPGVLQFYLPLTDHHAFSVSTAGTPL